jgi:GT2 family glycosyltransferase
MPTYNRAKLLGRAIDSALAQTAAELCEIIVVDDGSTDNTADVVAAYGSRVRYLRQANAGASAARNAGIRASTGEFVAFLDSDDLWEPDKIERQLAAFVRWPEAVLVGGRAADRFADGRVRLHPLPPIALDEPADFFLPLLRTNFLATLTVMVRREALAGIELFPEDVQRFEDYHLWVRLACRGPGVYVSAPLATYNADTPGSLSQDREAMLAAEIQVRYLLKDVLRERPDGREYWQRALARVLASARDRAYRGRRFGEAARLATATLWHQPWSRPSWEWGRLVGSLWRAAVTRPG